MLKTCPPTRLIWLQWYALITMITMTDNNGNNGRSMLKTCPPTRLIESDAKSLASLAPRYHYRIFIYIHIVIVVIIFIVIIIVIIVVIILIVIVILRSKEICIRLSNIIFFPIIFFNNDLFPALGQQVSLVTAESLPWPVRFQPTQVLMMTLMMMMMMLMTKMAKMLRTTSKPVKDVTKADSAALLTSEVLWFFPKQIGQYENLPIAILRWQPSWKQEELWKHFLPLFLLINSRGSTFLIIFYNFLCEWGLIEENLHFWKYNLQLNPHWIQNMHFQQ